MNGWGRLAAEAEEESSGGAAGGAVEAGLRRANVASVAEGLAGGAAVATAVGALGDPLADGVAAAVITDDLIHGEDGAAASGVADDSLIAAPVSFCGRWHCETNSGDGGEEGDYFFHGV